MAELVSKTNKLQTHVSEIKTVLGELGKGLRRQLDDRMAQSQKEAEEMEQALLKKLSEGLAEAQTRLDQRSDEFEQRSQRLAEASAEAREAVEKALEREAKALRESMEQGLGALEASCRADNQALRESLAESARDQQRLREHFAQGLEAASQSRRELGASLRQELRDSSSQVLAEASHALAASEASAALREQHLQGRLDALEAWRREASGELLRMDQSCQQTRAAAEDTRRSSEAALAMLQEEHSNRMEQIETETGRLQEECVQAAGILTRQVEWRLEQATQTLHKLSQQHHASPNVSCFSPCFEAAGTRGLQLELRLERRPQDGDGGDLSLYLWGTGAELVVRLFIGNESVVLRHTFQEDRPCGVRHLCFLSEQINHPDGSLSVGIEIHEAMNNVVRGMGPSSWDFLERQPVHGALVLQRYINHRLLELIQSQSRGLLELVQRKVDLVRSRAVKRVQWRLENAHLLLQHCAAGHPVCSTAFQAGGIGGLQLIFYPGGCSGAREGFCSFFVQCPVGCTIRCWLWAGRWRREARPEPTDQADLLGRMNFCRFENCIDPVDETIELALEIEEAQQVSEAQPQTFEAAGSQPALMTPASTGSVSLTNSLGRSDLAIMKVQQTGMPSSENTQQLPAIWTSQSFQSFGDLRSHPSRGSQQTRTPPFSSRSSPSRDCQSSGRTRLGLSSASDQEAPTSPLPAVTARGSKKQVGKSAKAPASLRQKYKEYVDG